MTTKLTKKLLTAILAMAMMLAMATSAFAIDYTEYPNLTKTADTEYAYTVDAGEDAIITLKVVPANDLYATSAFTKEQAEAIEWGAGLLSDEEMIMIVPVDPVAIDGGYAAAADVYVFAGATSGPNSFYAKNPVTGETMNFTVVVDGANEAPVTGIKNVYRYAMDGANTDLATVSNMTVSANAHYGATQYPSVLDAVAHSVASSTGFTANMPLQYGTYVLYSMTFANFNDGQPLVNGSRTLADGTVEYYGWQYRVYHNGVMQAISADLGADQYKLAEGDVILWMFTTYDETFPATFN